MHQARHTFPSLLIAGFLALAPFANADSGSSLQWQSDFNGARRQAMLENKLILVNIHAEWCGPCRLLQSTTLQNPSLTQRISATCIPLSVDADHHPQLIEQWHVKAFPTQLFLSPKGQIVGKLVGYAGAPEYLAALENAVSSSGIGQTSQLAKADSPAAAANSPLPTNQPQQTGAQLAPQVVTRPAPQVVTKRPTQMLPPVAPPPLPSPKYAPQPEGFVAAGSSSQAPMKSTEPSLAGTPHPTPWPKVAQMKTDDAVKPCDARVPVAMGGFCPVSMIVRAELTQGTDSFCLVYRGQRFLFRSSSERTMFLENPTRYLPAEDGRCVVTWAEEHRWIPGAIKYPAIFGDHVFLFPTDNHRKKFLEDPERYVDTGGKAYRSTGSAERQASLR